MKEIATLNERNVLCVCGVELFSIADGENRFIMQKVADEINESFQKSKSSFKKRDVFVDSGLDRFDLAGFLTKLKDGCAFYTGNDYKIFYDISYDFPYRWGDSDLNISCWYGKLDRLKIKKQVEWYENITKPVPVIVHENPEYMVLITEYDKGFLRSSTNGYYKPHQVTPASLDDIEIVS